MALITQTQVIDAPIDRVFDTVIDAGNYTAWNPTITASRRLDEGELRDGSRFEWRLKGFGVAIQEFQEFERNARVRFVLQTRRYFGAHRFRFSAQGRGTRIDHELEVVPRGMLRLLGPMIARNGRRNLRQTVEALQSYIEGTPSGQKYLGGEGPPAIR
jgi:uncharacterized protein YndB with AHSA1/START domain